MKRETSPLEKHIRESPRMRELKHRRMIARRRLGITLGTLFVVLVGGCVYAAHLPKLHIQTVVMAGNQVVDTDDVTAKVETYLSGSYAYAIPKRVFFLYPKQKIIDGLLSAFPRFKSVEAYRSNRNTLLITVSEVRGRALWCGADMLAAQDCYFTDDAAKIVSVSPQYSGNVYPRFYGGTLADPSHPLGQTFIADGIFQNLLAFVERIQAAGFQVKAVVLADGDEDSIMLDLGQGKTATVRFLKSDDYATLAGNLDAALGQDELKQTLLKNKSNLEYIDLRFSNKVYYKFTDGH